MSCGRALVFLTTLSVASGFGYLIRCAHPFRAACLPRSSVGLVDSLRSPLAELPAAVCLSRSSFDSQQSSLPFRQKCLLVSIGFIFALSFDCCRRGPHVALVVGYAASEVASSTALACLVSMTLMPSRTASIMAPIQRFLTARRVPSELRDMRCCAASAKVLTNPLTHSLLRD